MNIYIITWLLLIPLFINTMEYPKELLERDKILHEMYEMHHHRDVSVHMSTPIEGPENKPDIPQESFFKEKSKKYALYSTVIASILTTLSTLIIHFTTECNDK